MSRVRTIRLEVLPHPVTPAPLEQAAESFYLDRQANRCSPYTLTWYKTYVAALLDWLRRARRGRPRRVTANHMRAWLIDLQERGSG